MRIGINTGGGDAPGLNAVIHAVVLAAHRLGWEVLGIQTGYAGLIDPSKTVRLVPAHVESIVSQGGTNLETTNRARRMTSAEPVRPVWRAIHPT